MLSADPPVLQSEEIHAAPRHPGASEDRETARLWRWAGSILGILWIILVGTILCFNAPILSYFTSLMVIGWLQRWMRCRILFAWWHGSAHRAVVDPSPMLETTTTGQPITRPRWILSEKSWWPAALWSNLREGFVTFLCITLVLGPGCVLMLFAWEMGWLNSFNKGYEQAWIGPTTGILGSLLLIMGLIYVPMARAHMAAAGDARAFFDARLIWRLIRARLLAYVGLIALVVIASVPLTILKSFPAFFDQFEPWATALDDDAQMIELLRAYYLRMALFLFISLLVIHAVAARVYRKAVTAGLRGGWFEPSDLPPRVAALLAQLDLLPALALRSRGIVKILRWTWDWYWRRLLYVSLFLLGVAFAVMIHAGEFVNYHPFVGFMNHPLLQLPCVDYIPMHLYS